MKNTILAGLLVAICTAALVIGIYVSQTWLVPAFTGTAKTEQIGQAKQETVPMATATPAPISRITDAPITQPAARQRLAYTWKDSAGEIHMSDKPPPPDARDVHVQPIR